MRAGDVVRRRRNHEQKKKPYGTKLDRDDVLLSTND